MRDADCYRLNCPACGWSALCGEQQAAGWLRGVGHLRPGREPEWEILRELLLASLDRLPCPDCGDTGLSCVPRSDEWQDDSFGGRICEGCRQPIPAERLAAVPTATFCAKCQQAAEGGETFDETEYCPRCGSPMELRQRRGTGITRYEMVCSAGVRCQG